MKLMTVESEVRRPNHSTTEPPSERLFILARLLLCCRQCVTLDVNSETCRWNSASTTARAAIWSPRSPVPVDRNSTGMYPRRHRRRRRGGFFVVVGSSSTLRSRRSVPRSASTRWRSLGPFWACPRRHCRSTPRGRRPATTTRMPSRRGLVAPQNTFLEKLIRRSNSQRESSLLFAVFITGPPIHSVGGRLVTVTGVCRRL